MSLFINQLFYDPAMYVGIVVIVMLSICLHELAHGVAAMWQGDDTPKTSGHMTLNPITHMGWFAIVMLCVVGIAWGAMPVNPSRFKSKFGDAIVAFAGPLVNLVIGIGLALALSIWIFIATQSAARPYIAGAMSNPNFGVIGAMGQFADSNPMVFRGMMILYFSSMLNIVLFLFNLLPIPPLDGSHIVGNFHSGYRQIISNPRNGMYFLGAFLVVFMFGWRFLSMGGFHAITTVTRGVFAVLG